MLSGVVSKPTSTPPQILASGSNVDPPLPPTPLPPLPPVVMMEPSGSLPPPSEAPDPPLPPVALVPPAFLSKVFDWSPPHLMSEATSRNEADQRRRRIETSKEKKGEV